MTTQRGRVTVTNPDRLLDYRTFIVKAGTPGAREEIFGR